jgi:hypothetical protein
VSLLLCAFALKNGTGLQLAPPAKGFFEANNDV